MFLTQNEVGEGTRQSVPFLCVFVHVCDSPEAASGIAEHLGGVQVQLAVLLMGRGVPARVGDDDSVGQHGQGVLDNGHLQGITRRQVPQHT